MTYRVNTIYPAIQGEGVHAGVPMVLSRLQGCGVGCPWCDTRETWAGNPRHKVPTLAEAQADPLAWCELTAHALANAAAGMRGGAEWVLLTGGEPAEQDLGELVAAFHDRGLRVALETSGTAAGHLAAGCDWVCCSPKLAMPGGLPVLLEVVRAADEIKMAVGKSSDLDALERLLVKCKPLKPTVTICLQPISQSPAATALCVQTVLANGWRLSLQVHKFAALP